MDYFTSNKFKGEARKIFWITVGWTLISVFQFLSVYATIKSLGCVPQGHNSAGLFLKATIFSGLMAGIFGGSTIVFLWEEWLRNKNYGLENANCLRCFFDIQLALRGKAAYYQGKYKAIPEFKAGLHYGHVMAGEVGVVKRDIAFSGDVLNTAARIQAKCNDLGVNILFSKFLLDKLALPPHSFEPRKIGDLLLRGKQEKVVLYTV